KRYNNFVRVGRGGTFVRIGKDNELSDHRDEMSDDFQSAMPESIDSPSKRHMHRFIRIGRGMGEGEPAEGLLGDDQYSDEGDDNSFPRFRKSPSSFVRIGRDPNEFLRIGKSPSSFVRIGKSPSSFVRIGKSPSSFVRIGKSPSSFVRIGKSPSSFVRIGKSPSSFVRIGKALPYTSDIYNDKRPSSFVRIGRSVTQADVPIENASPAAKRPSSFVRIGKAPSSLNPLTKRPSSFVRIGKATDDKTFPDDIDSLKRTSSFVRIGKSSLQATDTDNDKMKKSSFVRIGKALQNLDDASETQNKHFDDKSGETTLDSPSSSDESMSNEKPTGDQGPIAVASRGSAFVRIGKIPSSAFVRIGKNSDVMLEEEPGRVYSFNRGSRGGHSSFVRIG
ncbi:hypothetical protein EGW08_002336, partial [Elysia chlorotica]